MKVLFCVQASSQHSARWINQFADCGWDLHVYENLLPGYGICPEYKCGSFHVPYVAKPPPGTRVSSSLRRSVRTRIAVRLHRSIPTGLAKAVHENYLTWLIRDLKPDFIHLLGLAVNWRNQGMPIVGVCDKLGGKLPMPLIYTCWGTDLDYFGQMSTEREGVERFLKCADYCITECDRDTRLAHEMGFAGHFCGKLPGHGGPDPRLLDEYRAKGAVSARRIIILKGRDHADGGDPVGRALVALKALALCSDVLHSYRIVILQASPVVEREAVLLSALHGLDIRMMPRLPYVGLMQLMGAARIVMAITVNDGLPSTLAEAMASGALPLHADLEPIREWIDNGRNGLLVPPEDVAVVAGELRRALVDDDLVDKAAVLNSAIVRNRLDSAKIKAEAIRIYKRVVDRETSF